MALSATCPPLVREDLIKQLKLPPIVDGRSAPVLFPFLVTPDAFQMPKVKEQFSFPLLSIGKTYTTASSPNHREGLP